jgi:dihydroorotate dehydrogenase (NAD+) catalytic subunit
VSAVPPGGVDLTTMLADVLLTSPVMVASGCGGSGRELRQFCDLSEVGAFVTRSVTREGSAGAPLPRTVETPSGLLSAVGVPGPGIDGFLATDLPWLLRHDIRAVVSVAGTTLGEYAELARRVGNTPGIAGIEVNLSQGYARDPVHASRAVSVIRRDTASGVPVFAKLWPGVAPVTEMASAVLDAGADAVVLTGSLPGLALDRTTLRPRLGAVVGELSGSAVRSVGLFAVWEVRRALPDACIIGVGGIGTGADALDYLAAGADAVQVGSAVFTDPSTPVRVVRELRQALASHGFQNPRQARDVAHVQPTTRGG